MLDTDQIDQLAEDLIDQVTFAEWLRKFEWDGDSLQPAWAGRQALERRRSRDSAVDYADGVHEWGFGHVVPTNISQHADYSGLMRTLCASWFDDAERRPGPVAFDSLTSLLNIKHLGIARVSKFICFLDQERYAIYDSRVSYALKDLTLDGTRRVFPFIGGKQVKHSKYVQSDVIASNADCMATVYVGFLRLLRRVAEKLNTRGGITDPYLRQVVGERWTPALLEMALFMAGQHREKTEKIGKLDSSFWKRLTKQRLAVGAPEGARALHHDLNSAIGGGR